MPGLTCEALLNLELLPQLQRARRHTTRPGSQAAALVPEPRFHTCLRFGCRRIPHANNHIPTNAAPILPKPPLGSAANRRPALAAEGAVVVMPTITLAVPFADRSTEPGVTVHGASGGGLVQWSVIVPLNPPIALTYSQTSLHRFQTATCMAPRLRAKPWRP